MGTKRKSSLEDAGKMFFDLSKLSTFDVVDYEKLNIDQQRKLIKRAIAVWQEVEKAL